MYDLYWPVVKLLAYFLPMKLRDNQTFMSLYFEPNAVEFATGEADSFLSADSWERNTKQFGQVATPEPIADLMAKWVMASKPSAVLDPAAGLGGLPEIAEANGADWRRARH